MESMHRRAARGQEQLVISLRCLSDAAGIRSQSRDPGPPERQSGSDREQFVSARQRRWTGGESADDREKHINVALRQAECLHEWYWLSFPETWLQCGASIDDVLVSQGGGITRQRAHHGLRPGKCMGSVRANYWIALHGSVVWASPEKLRLTSREERHAWRLIEAELRTKTVNLATILMTSQTVNVLQVRKKILWEKKTVVRPTRQVVEESLEKNDCG